MTIEDPTGGFGKWSVAGVPHRGWSCIDIEDLGAPDEICEMCERQEIRYVHHMRHPDYPDVLRCGCVCAGHMEEDLAGARRRETALRNASGRRRAWLNRKGWKISTRGNLHIKADGYHVTVFRKGKGWSAVVSHPSTGYERFAQRFYSTAAAAQLASFDFITFLKSRSRLRSPI